MNMNYENQILSELGRGPGTASDIAIALGVGVADIKATLRGLRDRGDLVMERGTYRLTGSDAGQRVAGSSAAVSESQMAKAPLPERGKAVKKKAAAAAKKPEKKAGTQKAPAPMVAAPMQATQSQPDKALGDQAPTLNDILNAMEERLSTEIAVIAIQNKDEKLHTLARLAEMSPDPLKAVLIEIADDLHGIEAA